MGVLANANDDNRNAALRRVLTAELAMEDRSQRLDIGIWSYRCALARLANRP